MSGRPSAAEREFTAFAAARAQALARTAYLLTGDHHRAEDLVQTTLFKTAKAWGHQGRARGVRAPGDVPRAGVLVATARQRRGRP